jgi:hypothetical protein
MSGEGLERPRRVFSNGNKILVKWKAGGAKAEDESERREDF